MVTTSRFTSICAALLQILALTLWAAAAVQARAGDLTSAAPMMVGEALQAGSVDLPCAMDDEAGCPAGCCHHHHCDDTVGCLAGAGASIAIVPSAVVSQRPAARTVAGRLPSVRQVWAGLSIPPPARPPND